MRRRIVLESSVSEFVESFCCCSICTVTLYLTLRQRHVLQIQLSSWRGSTSVQDNVDPTLRFNHNPQARSYSQLCCDPKPRPYLRPFRHSINMAPSQRIATITSGSEELRLGYIESPTSGTEKSKGTILLIHGFPETSYQFHNVIPLFSDAGYRVIAPDYRGAGLSSKPLTGYTKTQMAEDLHILIQDYLGIKDKIHIVGHDIGGMIAYAYTSRYADDVASVIWGECPLPGTSSYEEVKTTPALFHFGFHQIRDLPEALITGKEREYITHFYNKLAYNSAGITKEDVDVYTLAFSQPGAMRCGLEVYRSFEQDAEENRKWLEDNGKVRVPSLLMMGAQSGLGELAETMATEAHEGAEVLQVDASGHWIAEENPEGFAKGVLEFVKKQ